MVRRDGVIGEEVYLNDYFTDKVGDFGRHVKLILRVTDKCSQEPIWTTP